MHPQTTPATQGRMDAAHRGRLCRMAGHALRIAALLTCTVALSCGSNPAPSGNASLCDSVYGKSCGATCSGSLACPLGLHCVDGTCSADCTPSQGCDADEVCSLAGVCGPSSPTVHGTPCTPDRHCPIGFACVGEVCQAACGAAHPCPAGRTCMSSGACMAGAIIGDAATYYDFDAPPSEEGCIQLEVTFEKQTPTVVLLVDQSSSMDEPVGDGGETRWTLLRSAILSPAHGVLSEMQADVRFGLTMYTSDNGDGTCPTLSKVPIAMNNYDAIRVSYEAAVPSVNTPTGAAIQASVADLLAVTDPGPRYVLLVTDGLPDTCGDRNPPDGASQDAANQFTVEAAAEAYRAGVGLYILGVSSDIAPDHLQRMANAGAGLAPDTTLPAAAPYWVASDNLSDLASQIGAIVGTVRSCVFMLHGTVQPGYEADGVVVLDGKELRYGDPNGWKLDSASRLEVTGTACDEIRSTSSQSLSIDFPCGGYIPTAK